MTKAVEKKLPATERDRRGEKLEIGTTVAFNYSGQIDIGEIVKISYGNRKHWTNYPNYTYRVEYEVKSHTRPLDKPSKVSCKENMLAVENYD
jgi:hypothetical protein